MRISDWSSDVCSSDLPMNRIDTRVAQLRAAGRKALIPFFTAGDPSLESTVPVMHALVAAGADLIELGMPFRSEEHTSELQPLMRNSYAVFCLKKKKQHIKNKYITTTQYTTHNY